MVATDREGEEELRSEEQSRGREQGRGIWEQEEAAEEAIGGQLGDWPEQIHPLVRVHR